jgi:hypothetical protein
MASFVDLVCMNFGYTKLELFLPKLDQVLKEILKKKEGCRVNKNWAHFYKIRPQSS